MCWGSLLSPVFVLVLLGASLPLPSRAASPLERSWGSWESEEQPHTIVRKTVFVTPVLRNCPDGYEWNTELERCLRVFKYNRAEQYFFMLERLKALYVTQEAKKGQKELGPVHMDVPLNPGISLENETAKKTISEETVYAELN